MATFQIRYVHGVLICTWLLTVVMVMINAQEDTISVTKQKLIRQCELMYIIQ